MCERKNGDLIAFRAKIPRYLSTSRTISSSLRTFGKVESG
jgi:hypothetical protein